MLSGNVDNRGIGHVLAYFLGMGKSGVLSLSDSASEGELHISDGSVVGACYDDVVGEKALDTLLKLSSYRFKFVESNKLSKNLENTATDKIYKTIEEGLNSQEILSLDSILIPNKQKIDSTKSLDANVWTVLNLIGSGIIYSRLRDRYHGQGLELNQTLKELISAGFVIPMPGQPSQDIFLFPKPVRIGLDREETELFWHIVDGLSLFELLSKVNNSIDAIADLTVRIILKRKLIITDDSGRVLEPWNVFDALGLVVEPKKYKLTIVGYKPVKIGTIGIEKMLLSLWKQQSKGEGVSDVIVRSKQDGSRKALSVFEANIEQNEALISEEDLAELGYKKNQEIEIIPQKKS
ncbi:MAG TPA: DUF4388 domain-containing protein [Caldisericia bacterium]|nr:DUF4388 domain-containing protein [Caldisericia bacterium]HPF48124.1 DUF4388 domain-containing protein [Caldisericia bacterium]HPI83939.1 DUF4388 domain-containing protein [Caldisericia bacterium]HPQ92577.1 DUF4388 domain-containing protein [Caldisericia bacterium]HRV74325.1 DUF4388 domain-containing protein [Caldisericia bacterium]